MFTGIVSHQAKILATPDTHSSLISKLRIETPEPLESARYSQGESIAVDGVCLTLVAATKESLEFDVTHETLKCIAPWRVGQNVNLERALRVGDRLGGHFVLGHVDSRGEVSRVETHSDSIELSFYLDDTSRPFLCPKGSITINGVSLTIQDIGSNVSPARQQPKGRVEVKTVIVPHSAKATNLGSLKEGSEINIEVDYLAKVVRQGRYEAST